MADDDVRRPRKDREPEHLRTDVDRLVASILADDRTRHLDDTRPSRTAVMSMVEPLLGLMFPGYYGVRDLKSRDLHAYVAKVADDLYDVLYEQVMRALRYSRGPCADPGEERRVEVDCEQRTRETLQGFYSGLPRLRRLLSLDVQAAYDGDPAAMNTDEILLCYPGIQALAIQRLAHLLHRLEVPLVPRMLTEHAHAATGIDIHPGARIGASFFIDHGTGVVIGETTTIGDQCKLYQGVTLGARSFPKDERGELERGTKRHPTLEDHVTVYAGATILGGDTVIGAGSVIAGGVFITESVPPGTVVRAPRIEHSLRENPELPPPNYEI